MALGSTVSSDTTWGGTRLGAHVTTEDYSGVRFGAALSSATFPPSAAAAGTVILGHAVAGASDSLNISIAIGATKRFNRAASNYSNTMPADLTNTIQRYNIISLQGFNGPANAARLIAGGVKAAIYKNGIQMGYGTDPYLGSSLNAVYAVHPSEQPGGAGGDWDAGLTWNNGRMSKIGESGFQAQWANNTITAATLGGFNWVFVDDVKWKLNSYPAAYPNETAWRAATLAFIQGIYTPISAAGLGMVCNIGSVGADSFQGAFPSWLNYMDGYMDEGVGRASTSHSGSLDSGVWIPNRLSNLATAQAAGKLAMWEIPADDTDTAAITYGICMLLLGVDASGNSTIGIGGTPESDGAHYGHEVWTSVHTAALALGAPTGAATGSVTTGYFRQFDNGAVRLNNTTGTLTINGTSVAATTGLIS